MTGDDLEAVLGDDATVGTKLFEILELHRGGGAADGRLFVLLSKLKRLDALMIIILLSNGFTEMLKAYHTAVNDHLRCHGEPEHDLDTIRTYFINQAVAHADEMRAVIEAAERNNKS